MHRISIFVYPNSGQPDFIATLDPASGNLHLFEHRNPPRNRVAVESELHQPRSTSS